MRLPTISLVNFSTVNDNDAQEAARVVNRQVTEDFMPIWGHGWLLRLDAPAFEPTGDLGALEDADPEPVRADGVIYLVDESTLPGALGYHSINSVELPVGFVFTDLIPEWTATLSHEVLEMIADPTVNIFAPGPSPDPADAGKVVLHTYEVCDAVERFSYDIDGLPVSDFVTPWYFGIGEGQGTRNDFLGLGVGSFGVLPGCHLQYFDLQDGQFQTFVAASGDAANRGLSVGMSRKRDVASAHADHLDFDRRRPSDKELEKEVALYNDRCSHMRRAHKLADNFRVSRSARRCQTHFV